MIVLLAVATALLVLYGVLDPQARLARLARSAEPPADKPRCEAGQTADCVGGTLKLMVLPPAGAAASAPARP